MENLLHWYWDKVEGFILEAPSVMSCILITGIDVKNLTASGSVTSVCGLTPEPPPVCRGWVRKSRAHV